jgi:hypothetical protein
MRRREFLRVGAAGLLATTLPAAVVAAPVDEWGDFLGRIRLRMMEIVRREGRGPHRVVIDPPHSADGAQYRRVRLTLDAGGSLLDKIFFQWDEVWRGY